MRPERLGPRTSRHARTPPRRVRGGVPGARRQPRSCATSDMYARRGEQSRKPRQAGDRPRRRRQVRARRMQRREHHRQRSPAPGAVAVSFSASFRRQGNPFKLAFGKEAGTTKVARRGSNVSQIKARADGGKLVSCSIQMDGGWGRTINVRC